MDTKLRCILKENDLLFAKEIYEQLPISDKVLRRAVQCGNLKFHKVSGYNNKFFKLEEVKQYINDKESKDRILTLKTKCVVCEKDFFYQRKHNCSLFYKLEIENSMKPIPKYLKRQRCHECVIVEQHSRWDFMDPDIAKRVKEKIGKKTKEWWNSLTPEEREEKKKKMSDKRKKFWNNNFPLRKSLSESLSKHVSNFWNDHPAAKEELRQSWTIGMTEGWKEYKK